MKKTRQETTLSACPAWIRHHAIFPAPGAGEGGEANMLEWLSCLASPAPERLALPSAEFSAELKIPTPRC